MKFLTILTFALALVACGSDDAPNGENTAPAAEQRAPTVGKEIADEYNRSMDKARQVEEQALEQKRKIDAALAEAEGDT